MTPDDAVPAVSRAKDGRDWRIGTEADIAWIQSGTTVGMDITSAIPPVFEAYATIVVPDKEDGRPEHTRLVLRLLAEQSPEQPWCLGYLETGADDVVFPDAPRVPLYSDWPYVLVEAGPEQAGRWRNDLGSWRAPGPDLIFPVDRSWLLSWLWDDDWRCLGGTSGLVDKLLGQLGLGVRRVEIGEDATPPGYKAR